VLAALDGIRLGDEVFVLTWLHLAVRDVLRVRPRGDTSRPQQGVFTTRSPDRPNPIGLHRVEVSSVEGNRMQVRNLEAIDGTPVIDIKPKTARKHDGQQRWPPAAWAGDLQRDQPTG
jgi:tRNA-Thr(GGU) m(6)t(6)A37 methyltransferase TsaA